MSREDYWQKHTAVCRGILEGKAVNNMMALVALGILEMDDPDLPPYKPPPMLMHEEDIRALVEAGWLSQEDFDKAKAEQPEPDFSDLFVPRYGWMVPLHPDHFEGRR